MAIKLDLQPLWKILCDSLQDDLKGLKRDCPEMLQQATASVDQFCAMPVPQTSDEHMKRLILVGSMRSSWDSAVTRKVLFQL